MFKNTTRRTQTTTRRLRAGSIFLALTLALFSGTAIPAAAAPATDRYRVEGELTVTPLRKPICAGRNYDLTVSLANNEYTRDSANSDWRLLASDAIIGVEVTAESSSDSIVEISPASLFTGWTLRNNKPGELTFFLQAKENGYATLKFTATVAGEKHNATLPIIVKDCEYKLTMTYSAQQSSAGTFSLMSGTMNTLLKGESDIYEGQGDLSYSRTTLMAPCSFYSPPSATRVTIKGGRTSPPGAQPRLELEFTYGPLHTSSTVSCLSSITTGITEDPNGFLATKAIFPEDGGTIAFPMGFAGWSGTQLITVAPVENAGP